jgi:hypothetical protein
MHPGFPTDRSVLTNEPGQHLPHPNRGSSGGHDWILGGELTQGVFVFGLKDAKSPRSGSIQAWAEDHHLARIDQRLPVRSVPPHDLSLLVRHVEGEQGAGGLQSRYKGFHEATQAEPVAAA